MRPFIAPKCYEMVYLSLRFQDELRMRFSPGVFRLVHSSRGLTSWRPGALAVILPSNSKVYTSAFKIISTKRSSRVWGASIKSSLFPSFFPQMFHPLPHLPRVSSMPAQTKVSPLGHLVNILFDAVARIDEKYAST